MISWLFVGWLIGAASAAEADPSGRRDAQVLFEQKLQNDDVEGYLYALGRTRDPAVLPTLSLFLNDREVSTRLACAVALGWVEGSAQVISAQLSVEEDERVRAALYRSLGMTGAADDVQRLHHGLREGPQVRQAASDGLGWMLRAGTIAQPSPSLGADLARVASEWDPDVAEHGAQALYRWSDWAYDAVELSSLQQAWRRSPSASVRAWLGVVVYRALPESDREGWAEEVLTSKWRLAKVQLLGRVAPQDIAPSVIEVLKQSEDPWIRALVHGVPETKLDGEPLQIAQDGEAPPAHRTRAAISALDTDWTEAAPVLARADDLSVRQVVAEVLGRHLEAEATQLLVERIEAETTAEVALAIMNSLAVEGRRLTRAQQARVSDAIEPWSKDARVALRRAASPWVAPQAGPGLEPLVLGAGAVGVVVETTKGRIRMSLDPEVAPRAVEMFVEMSKVGGFDGQTFHRVVPGFVVQSGDPRGDGMGSLVEFVPDELSDQPFTAGSVGLARAGYDTGGSQWFITTSDQPHLRRHYTWFGRVTEGLDVATQLEQGAKVLSVTLLEP